jgi:hypothetical protein
MGNATGAGGGGASGGGGAGGAGGSGGGGFSSGRGFHVKEAPDRIFRLIAAFDIPEGVPRKVLAKATEDGLEAATDALPGRGSVRAEGALGSATSGRRRVRVELTVSGATAEATWGPLAEEAFAAAFLDVMSRKGHDARRVA